MKKFEITMRGDDCIKKSKIVFAKDKDEALRLAWELFPYAESVYVDEIKQ